MPKLLKIVWLVSFYLLVLLKLLPVYSFILFQKQYSHPYLLDCEMTVQDGIGSK